MMHIREERYPRTTFGIEFFVDIRRFVTSMADSVWEGHQAAFGAYMLH